MAGDRPRQPAYEIFNIKLCFQQSKSRPPRFKDAGAGERQSDLPYRMPLINQWNISLLKWIKIDQDNLLIGTAKAVARLISFAQITCVLDAPMKNDSLAKVW